MQVKLYQYRQHSFTDLSLYRGRVNPEPDRTESLNNTGSIVGVIIIMDILIPIPCILIHILTLLFIPAFHALPIITSAQLLTDNITS